MAFQAFFDSPTLLSTHHIYEGREASCCLNIVIVGCGLGGIAAAHSLSQAGHNVVILEAAREIGEVGVGVILPPSITRLLEYWGAGDALRKIGIPTSGIAHLRSTDGEMMAYTPFGEQAEKAYGSPNMFVHRADFHKILSDLALASPRVRIQLGARASFIDPVPDSYGKVSVTLATGEIVSGELVIGADGIKSLTRQAVVGHSHPPEQSGDAAYRATVPAEKLLSDPDLRSLVEDCNLTSWVGKNTRLVGYPISSGKLYNLVLVHPDKGMTSCVEKGDATELRNQYADFEPRVQKLLSFVEDSTRWKLMDLKPMKSWTHASGRVVLLGDACHPMLPYLAQGAAMAVEDAAALGDILSRLTSQSQLPAFLRAYERLRYARTTEMQLGSRAMQKMYHLPTGDENHKSNAADTRRQEAPLPSPAVQAIADNALTDRESNGTGLHIPSRSKFVEWFTYDIRTAVDTWWREEGQHLLSQNDLSRLSPYTGRPLKPVQKRVDAYPTALAA